MIDTDPTAAPTQSADAGQGGVRESFASGCDGTRLYVRHRPGPADRPAAATSFFSDGVLCDGFIWKYLWDDVASETAAAHWHYRGHGRSANPVDPDRLDIAAHAADLDAVRRHLGDPPAVLWGHSMGCQVALEAYRRRPEGVRAIVLVCGSYGRVTESFHGTDILAQVLPRLMRMADAHPLVARAVWSRLPARLSLRIALRTGEIDPASIRPDDMMPYFEHITHVDFPMFLRMLKAAGDHSAEEWLADVGVPVLVVAGDGDTFTPPRLAEEMAARLPRGEILMVRGGTHVAPLEQRDLVRDRVRAFLRQAAVGT